MDRLSALLWWTVWVRSRDQQRIVSYLIVPFTLNQNRRGMNRIVYKMLIQQCHKNRDEVFFFTHLLALSLFPLFDLVSFRFRFRFRFGFFFCPLSETFTMISIDKWLVPSNTVQDGTTHNNHERYGTLNYGAIQNESWRNRRWFSKGSHHFNYNSTILFFFWFCQINAFNALGRVEYLPKENHLLSGSGQRIELQDDGFILR